eukprot:CCRYP_019578-RB/>CCRYP_019578-RB protein AED:0.37 eAED:0.39 QI:0/0/0/1/0/0/2/0/449
MHVHDLQSNGLWTHERKELNEVPPRLWTSELGTIKAGGDPRTSTHETYLCSVREQADSIDAQEIIVMPMQKWNDAEATKTAHPDPQYQRKLKQSSVLRKITVGFGIGKLLQYVTQHQQSYTSNCSWSQLKALCSIDNFAVELIMVGASSELGWEIRGVHMITPFLSLQIDNNSSSSSCDTIDTERENGINDRNIVSTITNPFSSDCYVSGADDSADSDSMICHLLGVLIHYLFSLGRCGNVKQHSLPKDVKGDGPSDDEDVECNAPLMKKKSPGWYMSPEKQGGIRNNLGNTLADSCPPVSGADFSQGMSILGYGNMPNYSGNSGESNVNLRLSPLMDFGYPPSLSQLVTNLVDCGLETETLLFDDPPSKSNVFIGNERLYGRSKEIASLMHAFCRVASSGESESMFVGGFSGCGKTRLVGSIFESVRMDGDSLLPENSMKCNRQAPWL